jgi:hypothetical protein
MPIGIHIAPPFIIISVNRKRHHNLRIYHLGHHHLRNHHLGHHHSHCHLGQRHCFAAKYDGSGKNW